MRGLQRMTARVRGGNLRNLAEDEEVRAVNAGMWRSLTGGAILVLSGFIGVFRYG
jgi:hypothetical protein